MDSLKENGVDMSHLSISQSYAVLVGLEVYTKSRKRLKSGGQAIEHQKDRILHPDKVRDEEERNKDKSQSAEKEREFLRKQELDRQKSQQDSKASRSFSGKVSQLFKRMSIKDDDATATEQPLQDGQPND